MKDASFQNKIKGEKMQKLDSDGTNLFFQI